MDTPIDRFDSARIATEPGRGLNAAQALAGAFEGAPGILESEHWEFSFDNRQTNRTWSWRHVGERGRTLANSAAYADLKLAVDDAVRRGFSPAAGNWIVRGVQMSKRLAQRRALSA